MQASYRNAAGTRVRASREALLAVLEALGAPLSGPSPHEGSSDGSVSEALRLRRRQLWERPIEPAVVAWDGQLRAIEVRLPCTASGALSCRLELEGGEAETFTVPLECATLRRAEAVDGVDHAALDLPLRRQVPLGYHRLTVEGDGRRAEGLVISAPRRAYRGEPGGPSRLWGVFAPLYALHSATSLDIGDLRDLQGLREWVTGLGGHTVATLPLLATFLEEPFFEPSPYSPVSRRFWNEIYVDLAAVPEVAASPEAREALAAVTAEQHAAADGGRASLVDYPRLAAARRRVLEAAAGALFAGGSARRDELERYAAAHPDLDDYAGFRAACETLHAPWQEWPAGARAGCLDERQAPASLRDYHRYVQWILAGQFEASRAAGGAGLLLDLPLGVHPAGYDVWRDREAFLPRATTGAPPDLYNPKGQDWGTPPLHPEGIRTSGYAYQIACIRHLMTHSLALRIDHVMGMHRIFVLPPGRDARDGVYVRYRGEENYAILCLESVRARALALGEDLGTVPGYVRRAMAAHGVHCSYVAMFEVTPKGLTPPPPDAFASINTHDMAPYASFWRGLDIEERRGFGRLTEEQARHEAAEREELRRRLVAALVAEGLLRSEQASEEEILDAWLAFLACSDARAVIVSLEDLWLETAS
ncbi:MAG TPA: 4-alpha-glucanotransferase, partial [Actinomycetota bacterium]|nr:4-alpha-glucanotransferase [Actinomycetota bacterium]